MGARWSEAELATLKAGVEAQEEWGRIAARLPGRDAQDCYMAAYRRGMTADRPKAKPARQALPARACLSCRSGFTPEHSGNFICTGCRGSGAFRWAPA